MWRLVIPKALEYLVREASPGCFCTEASEFGIMMMPKEVEYQGVIFDFRKHYIDRDGDLFASEYVSGNNTFTIWNPHV